MLVLSRKMGEEIVLPDCGVTIAVLRVGGKRVRLGIRAPDAVSVHRQEVAGRIDHAYEPAAGAGPELSPAVPACDADPTRADLDQRLARWIMQRTGGRIRSLQVETADDRVTVRGRTGSYYVRQLAQAAAMEMLNSSDPEWPQQVEIDIEVVATPR